MKRKKAAIGRKFRLFPDVPLEGETFEELLQNLYEAIEGCLSVDVSPAQITEQDRVLEIAV
jgi:predicted RNase H-like HicB family nuclease